MSQMNLSLSLRSQLLMGGIDAYAVGGFKPELVFDFDDEVYRTGGSTTFSSAITHAATSNATMTGLRKWSLHNLLRYSEDFTNAAWSNRNISLSDNGDGSFNVTATANYGDLRQIVTFSDPATVAVYVKRVSGSGNVNLYTPSAATNETIGLTDEWQLFTLSNTPSGSAYLRVELAVSGDVIAVKYPHLYRSDRGGMVPASDGSTYVATTGTAVEPVRVDAEDGVGEVCWRPHNLLEYSEQFDNAYWSKADTTVVSNAAIAPDGKSSADKLVESASTSQHNVNKFKATSLNTDTFTLSIFVKAAERSKINLWLLPNNPNDFSNDGYVTFDLSAGEVASTVRAAASIVSVGNGWYRCSITPSQLSSSTSADLQAVFRLVDDSGNLSYTGDGTSGLYIWGAHLYRSDLGGMVDNPDRNDSYVPTTSAERYLPRRGHHVYDPENGAVVGSELVTNGTFDTDISGWSAILGSISQSSGELLVTRGGGDAGRALKEITCEVGKVYRLTLDRYKGDTASTGVYVGVNSGGSISGAIIDDNSTTDGSYEAFFVATQTDHYILLNSGSGTEGDSARFDNISVREVNPWVNEGLLHESEARTNLIDNSQLEGAVVGTVGSGGALPTGWSTVGFNSVEVVSVDTYRGAPRIRIKGTCDNSAGGSSTFPRIEIGSFTAAASTTYNYSAWGAEGGDTSNINGRDLLVPDGVSNFLIGDFATTSEMDFYSYADTTDASATAGPHTIRVANTVLAGDIGVTDLYISMPQLEAGSTPSSYIPNAGATSGATRAAETLTVPAANLPWPTPNVIGDELVTNGTFDTDISGWSSDNGIVSWNAAGYLDFDRNGESFGNHVYQNISTTAGKVYEVSYDLLAVSNQVDLRLSNVTAETHVTTGSKSYVFVATGATTEIEFDASASITATFSIDNISVREIDPLAVSIQMQGRVTYADTNAATEVAFWRWRLSSAEQMRSRIDTSGALVGRYITQQTANSIYDQATDSGTEAYSSGLLVPFNISSRHGSAFINGAADGIAYVANTTPTALPNLSSTDLSLGFDYMGTIKTFRVWASDLGDTGIEEAST